VTAILNALMALDRSLDNLENAAMDTEHKAAKYQHDLFNSVSTANGNGHAHNGFDPAFLAGRLDIAIERVEQMLREG